MTHDVINTSFALRVKENRNALVTPIRKFFFRVTTGLQVCSQRNQRTFSTANPTLSRAWFTTPESSQRPELIRLALCATKPSRAFKRHRRASRGTDFVALRGSERAKPARHSGATGATHSKARATRDRFRPAAARGRAARVRDASVGGHSRRTTKTSAGVNRNKMDAQVEMPCAGVKTPPHRFDSFSGLRRSGSGAIVSGTEARSIRDRARPRRHLQFVARTRGQKAHSPSQSAFGRVPPARARRASPRRRPRDAPRSRLTRSIAYTRAVRAAVAATAVRFSVLQRD